MAKATVTASPFEDKSWQAESDLRTLIDAEKIKGDPARMKAAMAKASEMKKAVTAIGKDA